MNETSKKIVVSNLMRCKNKQSFFALHQLQSKIHSIDPSIVLEGWGLCLKSKVSHFIGHTQGKGKPKVFLNMVDKYLTDRGFEI
jgi:hypothetical protein